MTALEQSPSKSIAQTTLALEMRIRAQAMADPRFCEALRLNPAKAATDFLGETLPAGIRVVPLEQLAEGLLYVLLPPAESHIESLEKIPVSGHFGVQYFYFRSPRQNTK